MTKYFARKMQIFIILHYFPPKILAISGMDVEILSNTHGPLPLALKSPQAPRLLGLRHFEARAIGPRVFSQQEIKIRLSAFGFSAESPRK
jgi:hypothetical protein